MVCLRRALLPPFLTIILALLLQLVPASAARAGGEGGPAVVGRNSRIQLSGTGWAAYRYLLADEQRASAPGSELSDNRFAREGASSFDIDRLQLNAEYAFTERIGWKTELEAENLAGASRLYLKRAYVKIRDPFGLKGTAFRFGQLAGVVLGHQENVWGYRSVSKDALELYLGISSTWVGAAMEGKQLDGRIEFDAAVTNEVSYSKTIPTYGRGKYKTFMGRLTLTPLPQDPSLKGLHLTLYGQYNAKHPPVQSDTAYVPAAPDNAADNYDLWYEAFPYYKTGRITLGVELAEKQSRSTTQKLGQDPAAKTVRSRYASALFACELTPALGCIARADFFDPNTGGEPAWVQGKLGPEIKDLEGTTLFIGVTRTYAKGVQGILDLAYTKFEDPSNRAAAMQLPLDPDVTLTARMVLSL